MKGFFQETVINGVALYLSSLIFSGLTIGGGFWSFFVAAVLVTIGFRILRPVLNLITMPLNVLSFGLFQVFVIAFVVFLITLLYPPLHISAFQFQGLSFSGVIIQPFYVNSFLSYVIISATIYLVNKAISWLFDL